MSFEHEIFGSMSSGMDEVRLHNEQSEQLNKIFDRITRSWEPSSGESLSKAMSSICWAMMKQCCGNSISARSAMCSARIFQRGQKQNAPEKSSATVCTPRPN